MINFCQEQDLFLNFSDSEGNSMSKVEAMACRSIPVVTNISGVRDSIVNDKNGFIVA